MTLGGGVPAGFESPGPGAAGCAPGGFAAVDHAVEAGAADAISFLRRLVAVPSVAGREAPAQEIVAAELARLGFAVSEIAIPAATGDRAPGGVPPGSYAGRPVVLGRLNPGAGPALLLNGHVDVVPADPAQWRTDPFTPVISDGWLAGRGAGDMKGGLAMGLLAVAALRAAAPATLTGELSFLSVIEEECTGNGTLAAGRAGALGDAVILLEPTGLDLLTGGVGILWAEITVDGLGAHAESADRAVNPVRFVPPILAALAGLEAEMREHWPDPALGETASPYNVNIGTLTAGDWPSSVPGQARLGVRVGYPRQWTPADALERVRAAIAGAAAADPWLAAHPPRVAESGYRAEGHLLPAGHPLADAVAAAHAEVTGAPPRRQAIGSTTDARYYLNQFGRPALAYGPRARAIHGPDEAVDLASIVTGARVLARFIAAYFASGGLPGESSLPYRRDLGRGDLKAAS